jgi:hypothetical protein
MKLTLENTKEQVELIQAMASKDPLVAMKAQLTFTTLMSVVLSEATNQAKTIGNFYTNISFNEDSAPIIPLDLYADVTDMDYLSIWSQTAAGGLGSNEVRPPTQEMHVATYDLVSAISFDKKHAAKSRLDVIAKSLTRLFQEVLFKQDQMAIGPIMSAMANASTNGKAHVFRTAVATRFLMDDLNNLLTRMKRINTSFIKGTPEGSQGKVTDILFSPESAQELRSMAYNAINTKTAPQSGAIKDSVAAPESIRSQMFDSTGVPNFFGISFHEFNECGVNQRWNTVFDVAAAATTYAQADGTTGAAAFDGSADELMLGIDRSRDALIRMTSTSSENGSEFTLSPDDQFNYINRANKKIGWVGGLNEGRVILDNRALVSLIR